MTELENNMEAKLKQVQVMSEQKDLDNKKRELEEGEQSLTLIIAEKERTKKEIALFSKISKVMIDNYGKLPESREHTWENQSEYWILMKEKQALDNERLLAKFEQTILNLSKQERMTKENINGLKSSILLQSVEIKKNKRHKK